MNGSVNVPGVNMPDVIKAVDTLAADIIRGDVSATLENTAGEEITTRDGVEIRAHRKIGGADENRSYTNTVISAAVANVTRMVEREYIAVH